MSHNQLPAHRALGVVVPVVVRSGQCPALDLSDFQVATDTSINPGVGSHFAGFVDYIERTVAGVVEVMTVLEDSHRGVFPFLPLG